jgi:hypothetical protein
MDSVDPYRIIPYTEQDEPMRVKERIVRALPIAK